MRFTIATCASAALLATLAGCSSTASPTAAAEATASASALPSPSPSPTGDDALCQAVTTSGTRDALTVDVGTPDWTNSTWDDQFAQDLNNFADAAGGGGAKPPFGHAALDADKLAADEALIALSVHFGQAPDTKTFNTATEDVRAFSADLTAIGAFCGS